MGVCMFSGHQHTLFLIKIILNDNVQEDAYLGQTDKLDWHINVILAITMINFNFFNFFITLINFLFSPRNTLGRTFIK